MIVDVTVAQEPNGQDGRTTTTTAASPPSSSSSSKSRKVKEMVVTQSTDGIKVKDFSSKKRMWNENVSTNEKKLGMGAIVLTSKNFATTITTRDVWLVEFYTPWCSHCKNFERSYANIARAFHSSPDERIRVAKVDCSMEKALMTRFSIEGFPSFVLISGWEVYEFEDPRTEANLMSFARGGYKKQDVSAL
jgi:protein disulfide-isomerase-like protein